MKDTFDGCAQDSSAPSVDRLIARLAAAHEGGAKLDARIQALEYGEEFDKLDDGPRGQVHARDHLSVCWITKSGKRYTCWYTKAYTRSLDAALTLVPPDRMWFIGHMDPSDMRFTATVSLIENVGCETWLGHSPIPAIAMCIAALRARAASSPIVG